MEANPHPQPKLKKGPEQAEQLNPDEQSKASLVEASYPFTKGTGRFWCPYVYKRLLFESYNIKDVKGVIKHRNQYDVDRYNEGRDEADRLHLDKVDTLFEGQLALEPFTDQDIRRIE